MYPCGVCVCALCLQSNQLAMVAMANSGGGATVINNNNNNNNGGGGATVVFVEDTSVNHCQHCLLCFLFGGFWAPCKRSGARACLAQLPFAIACVAFYSPLFA